MYHYETQIYRVANNTCIFTIMYIHPSTFDLIYISTPFSICMANLLVQGVAYEQHFPLVIKP
jgi:hypothetical protein